MAWVTAIRDDEQVDYRLREDAGCYVETERDGASIRYRLNISAVEEAVGFLLALVGAGAEETAPTPAPAKQGTQP